MKKSLKFLAFMFICSLFLVTSCGPTVDSSSSIGSNTTTGGTFRIAKTWDRTGIRNHYHGGSNIGALEWLAVEPLVQYVRSTDELHYLLAEEITHNDDHTSVIKIRDNAKWHTGESFVAEDVMAFFHINFVTLTNYLSKPIEKINDKTVKLTWKEWMEPNSNVKTLLIAENKVGSVQYSIFKTYIDRCQEILTSQEKAPDGYTGWAPFGYINSTASEELYMANYNSFKAQNPKTFVATGPFKLFKVTQNQMILVKNEDYYFADNVNFDRVIAYNISDTNNIYNMLSTGEIDYQDGLAPEATLNAILNANKDMAHLKMFDPGAIGLVFNLEKEIWDVKVREAFQYLFNREEMRNAGNKYAIPSYYPMIGMAPSEAKSWMAEEDFNKLPVYRYDQLKAEQLLKEAGWTKTSGAWYDKNGAKVKLSLGYDGGHPGMSGVAEAVSSTLTNFGVEIVLKRASDFGTWFDTAKAQDSVYDFSVNWTDLNMSFSYPTGSFRYTINDIDGPIMHLKGFTQEDFDNGVIDDEKAIGQVNLHLDKANGSGKFYVYRYLSHMYSMSETELQESLADLTFGLAGLYLGVQFYQNVTGSFVNTKVLAGLPLQSYIDQNRNVTFVPEAGTDDFFAVARTNMYYSQGVLFSKGYYQPK